jgi:tRNA-dihydrouridine synthase
MNGKLVIKSSYKRDLKIENNDTLEVIPQIMTNSDEEFLFVVKYIQELGYKELNWNLGCPYPMVTKKGMGSGLICNPEKIDHILKRVHNETDITVSMKMRMGYETPKEIQDVFPILDKYPLKNIAIHARIGKQLYKGGVDLESFQQCIDNTKHKLYYNGDITSVAGFKEMQERFPNIDHWMIGRGLIADPFLPKMIKDNTTNYPENSMEIFKNFHDTIFEQYNDFLSGPTPIRMKMLGFWEYFAQSFDNPQKVYKKIKKASNIQKYQVTVTEILAHKEFKGF